MQYGYSQMSKKKFAKSFKNEEILHATPEKLMIKIYDHIIIACRKRDKDKASAGLVELINSLNFDYEPALQLLNLYRFCLNNLKDDGFDTVADILNDLKETWTEALNNQGLNLEK